MRAIRVIVALVVAGVGAGAAVAAVVADRSPSVGVPGTGTGTVITATVVSPPPGGVGPPTASPKEQTHPRVRPSAGGARTVFMLWFELRDTPGHVGVLATDYRVQVSPPSRARAACAPGQPAPVRRGRKGETVRLRLPAPPDGWCIARYTITVYLERGPYCPRPAQGKPPTPCPEFATQELEVGMARFRVR